MRRQNGFSLVELLIVVAIILVIAAIAIPNLLRSRMAANEASAAESIRMINTAEAAYYSVFPTQGYSNLLTDLGGASPCGAITTTAACVLDNAVSNATGAASGKSGYYFTYTPVAGGGGPVSQYTVLATPVNVGITGLRQFFTDESYVIRYSTTGPANLTSPPL